MAEGCLEHLSACNYKVIRDLSYSLKDERCFGKTLVGRREAFDVHKKRNPEHFINKCSGFFFCAFDRLEEDEIFYIDEDYNGFSSYEFIPDEEIESIYEYCKEHQELKNKIKEFHRLRQVKDALSITFDISSVAKTYKEYYAAYNGFRNQPLVSINKKMMFDFYKNTKTDYEKALFSMYAGIRSIIGNKDFAETTGGMIKCRMFGAKNQTELEFILRDRKVKSAYKQYTTDYHYKKMLKELVVRGFLQSEIGYNERTYVSCKLDMKDLEDAIVEHIKQKSLNYGANFDIYTGKS